jgi:hypothetical protein
LAKPIEQRHGADESHSLPEAFAACYKDWMTSLALALAVLMAPSPAPKTMNEIADAYVHLVLALGEHDADYVDAYYGPPEWRTEAAARKRSLEEIQAEGRALMAALAANPPKDTDELVRLRHQYLSRQLSSLVARAELVGGRKRTFDEESRALYDATAPTHTEKDFEKTLADLGALLPGDGSLSERYEAFRKHFVIPPGRLEATFNAAIAECRRRTLPHVDLPAGESFTVEYVKGKPWSAYNWYKGDFRSVIQVNTDLPVTIDRAVDLACHEGYPGHHVYNALLEKHLVRDRGWREFTVYPLFSPQSLIAEGTANYGIEVAFPGEERLAFEKSVLYPAAGLDPARADTFHRVQVAVNKLQYAGNEAARRYLEGRIDKDAAVRWLLTYGLMPEDRARQRIRFFDTYRSYVINYNLGQDLVRKYVEGRGGTAADPEKRWKEFKALLASPRLPGGLQP